MSRRSDEWYRDAHPPACTCVACNDRRLSRHNRPTQRRSGYSPRRTYSNPYRKPNWLKRILLTSILLLVVAWSGLVALHYSNDAIFSDAVAMTGDDARVIMSCTEDIDAITNFIVRDDTTPLTTGLQGDSSDRVVNEICKGDIVSARTLSNRFREQARVARLNTPNTPSSMPQRNIFTPTPPSNTSAPPNTPLPSGVAAVSLSEPSPIPAPSSEQSGFEFFKSTQ